MMRNFKIDKILAAIDFSSSSFAALQNAAIIAKEFNAELILFHVIEKHWEQFSIVVPEMRISVPDNMVVLIEKRLDEIAKEIYYKYGLKPFCETNSGAVFAEINAAASRNNADLIIIGTHGANGFFDYFLGSNAFKIVNSAQVPVMSIHNSVTSFGFHNILVPIDNSAYSSQKLSHAILLAKQFNATIFLLGLPDFVDATDMQHFNVKLQQMEERVSQANVPFHSYTLQSNAHAAVVLDYIKQVDADLVIIMTDQNLDQKGLLLGSFAQQIVNSATIPTLSIRPLI